MNTKYSLKNFRVFGESGVDFNMTPITILTGCNSSGKSSVIKSILLIKDFVEKMKKDVDVFSRFNPGIHYLDFSLADVNLSNFNSVVNRNSKEKEIVYSYTLKKLFLDYKLELHFEPHKEDVFNYGWPSKIFIYTNNNELLLQANSKGNLLVPIYLNINNSSFLQEFEIVAYAISLNYVRNKVRETYGDFGEYIENQEEYDKWNTIWDSIVKSIKGRGRLFELMVSHTVENINKIGLDSNQRDYSDALKYFSADSLLFYFPMFELLRNKTKEQVVDIISKAETEDFLDRNDSMRTDAIEVAEDFNNSEFDSFIDYYRSYENVELNNVLATQSEFSSRLGNLHNDFIDGLKALAGIRYEPGNDIHMLGSSSSDGMSFSKLYKFLSRWQWKLGPSDAILDTYASSDLICSSHRLYSLALSYVCQIVKKILLSDEFTRFKYVGNFHYNLQRLYVFDGKENEMGQVIKSYVRYKTQLLSLNKSNEWARKIDKERTYVPGFFVDKWLKKLKIGKSLNIIEDEDGLGAKVFIRKDSNKRGYPLADEGYGVTQLVTILLNIEVEILQDQIKKVQKYISNDNETTLVPTISLEEPEVSLHPSLQSKLADIFLDAYKSHEIHFIIETHSEYMIRRTQAFVANYKTKEEFASNPFSVIYIGPNGGAYNLEYLETGRFNRSFGPGFFDEATRSSMEILKRERRDKNGKKA